MDIFALLKRKRMAPCIENSTSEKDPIDYIKMLPIVSAEEIESALHLLSENQKTNALIPGTFKPLTENILSSLLIKELIEVGEGNEECKTLVPKLVKLYMAKRLL